LFGLGSYWYSAVMGVLGWICTACVCRETIEVLLSLNVSSYTLWHTNHKGQRWIHEYLVQNESKQERT